MAGRCYGGEAGGAATGVCEEPRGAVIIAAERAEPRGCLVGWREQDDRPLPQGDKPDGAKAAMQRKA